MTHRLVAGLLLLPAVLSAQSALRPMEAVRIATVEGVTEYRLANGLPVVLAPDPSLSTIVLNMTHLAGSCQEDPGEAGVAHLLEHFVATGSLKHPEGEFAVRIAANVAAMGG